MPEKTEMTVKEFLDSLKRVLWRIKRNNQWYELRVAKSDTDLPFVDKKGELFGLKNSKINFFIFKSGTNEPADWVSGYLYDMLEDDLLQKIPVDPIVWKDEDPTLDLAFVHYLLDRGGFVIFNEAERRCFLIFCVSRETKRSDDWRRFSTYQFSNSQII